MRLLLAPTRGSWARLHARSLRGWRGQPPAPFWGCDSGAGLVPRMAGLRARGKVPLSTKGSPWGWKHPVKGWQSPTQGWPVWGWRPPTTLLPQEHRVAFLGGISLGQAPCSGAGRGAWGRGVRAWLLLRRFPFPVSSAAALAAGLVQSSGSGRKVAFRGEEREIKI